MTLKPLASYSEKEIEAAEKFSSVFSIYRQISEGSHRSLSEKLRIERAGAWIECGLATLHRSQSTSDICEFWSKKADQWLTEAFDNSFSANDCALFAMGKLGANELNLSSDVDIIIVRKDSDIDYTKSLREFNSLISERNEKSFVFRIDLNLRPGGRFSQPIPTSSEFEEHYTTKGETWERLAQVRLRPITGNNDIIKGLSKFSSLFAYRKHLDYSLMEDLKRLRSSIRSEYEIPAAPDFHLKLQPGGIRDIELFVNALQIIHGGKYLELRTNSTTQAVHTLRERQLLPKSDCDFLIEQYWKLRHLENLVQFQSDRQTHIYREETSEAANLAKDFGSVESLVTTLLGPIRSESKLPLDLKTQKQWLFSLRFTEQIIEQEWIPLWNLGAKSTHAQRDEEQRQIFLYDFVESLAKNGIDKNTGLRLLHEFIRSTRAKATFFSTLNHKPKLIADLARLFSISPYIGGVICRRPELLDSYILRSVTEGGADLESKLDNLHDRKLLTEIFLLPKFLENLDLEELFKGISETADIIAQDLLENLKNSFEISDVELLALGKWGGQELGLRSDLDFIFVTNDDPTEKHFKLARRFINLLTGPGKAGSLYSVDLRLRPSGSSGPVLVSKKNLRKYLETEASPWELQAYTKARIVGSNNNLQWIPKPRSLNNEDLNSLWNIREKAIKKSEDIKYAPGGLLDIELHTQTAYLQHFDIHRSNLMEQIYHLAKSQKSWLEIAKGYETLRTYEQLLHICTDRSTSIWSLSSDSSNLVARAVCKAPNDVSHEIETTLKANFDLLKTLDPYGTKK